MRKSVFPYFNFLALRTNVIDCYHLMTTATRSFHFLEKAAAPALLPRNSCLRHFDR